MVRGKSKGNNVKITLRVSPNLQDSIQARAKESGVSMNDWMVKALTIENYMQVVDRECDLSWFAKKCKNNPAFANDMYRAILNILFCENKEDFKQDTIPFPSKNAWFTNICKNNPDYADNLILEIMNILIGGCDEDILNASRGFCHDNKRNDE